MKAKIIILTPVFNDWKNLTKLLARINIIFRKKLKKKFDLVVVNDCSTENFNYKKLKNGKIDKLTVISLLKNVGSQRSLAIGIRHIKKIYKKNYKIIVIDSDGQDNPSGIKKLLKANYKKKNSVVVNRGQRKEPFWFKFFYEFYSILIVIFVAKKIRFGNYCLLNSNDVEKIFNKTDLWSAFPPTLLMNIKNISSITLDREKRFTGKSKMNFAGLLFHAFKVFSVFRNRILISSILYTFIFYHFFKAVDNLKIFLFIILGLVIFNMTNFFLAMVAKRFLKKFLTNFRIKTINYNR